MITSASFVQLIAVTVTLWSALLIFANMPVVHNHYFRWLRRQRPGTRFWIPFILRLVYIIPTFLTLYYLFWATLGYLVSLSQTENGTGIFAFGVVIGSLLTIVFGVGIKAAMALNESEDSDDDVSKSDKKK